MSDLKPCSFCGGEAAVKRLAELEEAEKKLFKAIDRIKELEKEIESIKDSNVHKLLNVKMVHKESKWMIRNNLEQQAKGVEDALGSFQVSCDAQERAFIAIENYANELLKQAGAL